MTTVIELQQAIQEEEERHREEMEKLYRQRETLRSILEDQQQSFQELITRVTRLRVAKGEYLAAETDGSVTEIKFDTGNSVIDNVLYTIQEKVRESAMAGGTLLAKLSNAARQGVIVSNGRRVSILSSNSSAIRTSNIAVVTRHEIRGMQPWAQKHYKKCNICGIKREKLKPWEQVDEKVIGMAAVPDIKRIPGKSFSSGSFRFKLDWNKGKLLNILHVSTIFFVKDTKNGGPLMDPKSTAAQISEIVMRRVQKEIEKAKEEAKKAPWNQEATKNLALSGAVEMFLHSLNVKADVSAISQKGSFNQIEGTTPLRVDVVISTPMHIPTIDPFIELLKDKNQRTYIVKYIVQPLAERIGALFGYTDIIIKYTNVAVNTFEALYRIIQRDGFLKVISRKDSTKNSNPSPEDGIFSKIYSILLALAVFGTTLQIECTVPKLDEVNNIKTAKKGILSLARSFLKIFTTPNPYTVPPVNDPTSSDVVVRLINAPTVFLEILNSTFSSDKRLPSTSRVGVVDFLASPKSKIRYGLKFFSEIVVDLFRPFTPTSGVVIADENGKGGRAKATGCTPITDLPPDIVKANIEVDMQARQLISKLQELQQVEIEESNVERQGKEMAQRVLEQVQETTLYTEIVEEFSTLNLNLVSASWGSVDVWLPLGFDFANIEEKGVELLHLYMEGFHRPA